MTNHQEYRPSVQCETVKCKISLSAQKGLSARKTKNIRSTNDRLFYVFESVSAGGSCTPTTDHQTFPGAVRFALEI